MNNNMMEQQLQGFDGLRLMEPIRKALHQEGYIKPTPIQEQAIPHILNGNDILGCAQTGTGKTAAFSLPMIQLLSQNPVPAGTRRGIRALILTPTRELAIQIGESIATYGKHTGIRHTVIFGGVAQRPQENALRQQVDILVATPGRLLDLLGQNIVNLRNVEIFTLDEADRMLDMGFIHDVNRIIDRLPAQRQTLFFSATMPTEIQGLADSILYNPVKVEVAPVSSTAERVQQQVYFVEKDQKRTLLLHLLQQEELTRVLIFTRTKHGADRAAKDLNRANIKAEAIHGDKTQQARQRALNSFKSGQVPVLVATDIAARGIDVEEISHVINYDLPNVPETYVHRIGRTGRAAASGMAMSFCNEEERAYLKDIQKLIRKQIPVVNDHPWVSQIPMATEQPRKPAEKTKSRGGQASGRKGFWRNRRHNERQASK